MLKKVMKYEGCALWRVTSPLFLIMAGVSVLAFLLALFISSTVASRPEMMLAQVTVSLFYVFLIASLFLVGAIFAVLVLSRFFTTCFSDEGYLTFMLPVPLHRLLLGKAVTAYLFFFVYLVALCGGLFIGAGLPYLLGSPDDFAHELVSVFEIFPMLFGLGGGGVSTLQWILTAVRILVQAGSILLLAYTSIVIGSTVMKKHKLFGSVIFGFVTYTVVEILNSLISFLFLERILREDFVQLSETYFTFSNVMYILLFAALGVAGYFISYRLLDRHLNLE